MSRAAAAPSRSAASRSRARRALRPPPLSRRRGGVHGGCRRSSVAATISPRRAPCAAFSSISYAEDLERKAGRGHSPLVRRRRRGADPRPSRHAHRRHAPRQGQAEYTPARRHRRLRRRRQRGEDPRHREEARREDLLPPLGLPGRPAQPDAARAARAPADRGDPQGREGHAPDEQAGERARSAS